MENQTNKKQHKQGRKNAAKFIGFILVFCAAFFSLQYLLTPDYDVYEENGEPALHGGRAYARLMLHDMYTSKKNIDILFLGSSHTFYQYIPSIIDKYTGMYSFNGGSSSQSLDGSYAVLVEAGKRNDINTVFLEICPTNKGENYSDRGSLPKVYVISDYMKFGFNKIRFLLNATGSKYYVNSFFPLLRNKEKYSDMDHIYKAIKRKTDPDYINYAPLGTPWKDKRWYYERGYIANTYSTSDEDWKTDHKKEPIKNNMFSEDELGSLNDIVKYCKKKNIRLILISTPVTDFNLTQYGNYDYGREQISDFAKDNGIEFYDFDLCKPEYFTYESEKFLDQSHMNHYASTEYSNILGKFLSGQITEDELFYKSYQEKLDAMGNRVFGLDYKVEEKGNEKIVHLDPIASAEFPVYVNVKKTPSNGKETQIMQKQLLEDLHFNKGEKGKLTIEVLGDSPNGHITNIIHIDY